MPQFSDLPLHPLLASTITARGYETATPVQAAVFDPQLAGRDLLVSSQTGSGKTLAFGVLIAETLLGQPAAPTAAGRRVPPRSLVVAPTRELATQVARELDWLLADARLKVAAFTGGTALGPDQMRLRAGVEVVVGTPGRLVDLHRRKALDLSAIAALVLDEADEMLDLGFKEDLEYLLGQAPKERRTLMFSATLPREIERLAATFQRDAARVDARAGQTGGAHSDINYVGHLVRPQERLAAVVNVLLAAGESKAIVFCRTREGVSELHERLCEHGFRAVAMSGERAQGERDRALDALRSGRARILVATNVAARGLDLPDVDLVVHADLPENADSLTHRSGRTGRAGKKGTSMVIADLRERRKAERLLSAARISGGWTPPPTAEEVQGGLEARLVGSLLAEAALAQPRPDLESLADRMRATLPERALISLLLAREVARLPRALPLTPVEPDGRVGPKLTARPRIDARADARDAGPARPSSRDDSAGAFEQPGFRHFQEAVLFRVNLGLESQAEPRWLLPLICRRGGITRREVGAIRVGPRFSTFEIAAMAADDFALASSAPDPRAPHVRFEPVPIADESPRAPEPAPAPQAPAPRAAPVVARPPAARATPPEPRATPPAPRATPASRPAPAPRATPASRPAPAPRAAPAARSAPAPRPTPPAVRATPPAPRTTPPAPRPTPPAPPPAEPGWGPVRVYSPGQGHAPPRTLSRDDDRAPMGGSAPLKKAARLSAPAPGWGGPPRPKKFFGSSPKGAAGGFKPRPKAKPPGATRPGKPGHGRPA